MYVALEMLLGRKREREREKAILNLLENPLQERIENERHQVQEIA